MLYPGIYLSSNGLVTSQSLVLMCLLTSTPAWRSLLTSCWAMIWTWTATTCLCYPLYWPALFVSSSKTFVWSSASSTSVNLFGWSPPLLSVLVTVSTPKKSVIIALWNLIVPRWSLVKDLTVLLIDSMIFVVIMWNKSCPTTCWLRIFICDSSQGCRLHYHGHAYHAVV